MTVIFVSLIQLSLALHVRNTVADAASSAARYGALGDRTAADARERASMLLATALGSGYAQDISASVQQQDGIRLMTVTVSAPIPLLGLIGPAHTLEVTGHAVLTQ